MKILLYYQNHGPKIVGEKLIVYFLSPLQPLALEPEPDVRSMQQSREKKHTGFLVRNHETGLLWDGEFGGDQRKEWAGNEILQSCQRILDSYTNCLCINFHPIQYTKCLIQAAGWYIEQLIQITAKVLETELTLELLPSEGKLKHVA